MLDSISNQKNKNKLFWCLMSVTSVSWRMSQSESSIIKISITRDQLNIWGWFWACLKANKFLFQMIYHTWTFCVYFVISNFWSCDWWRLNWSCDQILAKKLVQNFSEHNLGKVTRPQLIPCSRFREISRNVRGGVDSSPPWPL